MSRWVIKWNGNDAALTGKPHDWAAALNAQSISCYGRAEGRGGETLGSVSAGNVALAYQVEDRSFYGVVRIITVYSNAKPAYLVADRVQRFAKPVRLSALSADEPLLADVGAFQSGGSDSMRRLSPDEYRLILEGCGVDAAMRAKLKI